jgi:VWFA-related protein
MAPRPVRLSLFVLYLCSHCAFAQKPGGGGHITPPRSSGTVNRSNGSNYGGNPSFPAPIHRADDEASVEFRTETILVQVPTVVTDKSGSHIRGLSSSDFRLLENGKEQKIVAFEEIESGHSLLPAASPHAAEISNLAASGVSPRNITIIALDSVNTPFLDQAFGRKQLIKYLAANVNSEQIVGLVAMTSKGLRVLHGLTSDPKVLIKVLQKFNGEISSMEGTDVDAKAVAAGVDVFAPRDGLSNGDTEAAVEDFILHGDAAIARVQQDRAVELTMRAFLDIAWSVSGIPGRKSLIWATGGFPFYLDSPNALPSSQLAPLYEQAVQALNDAAVSVYPVDVRGLVNYSPSADVTYSPHGSAALGPAYARSVSARSWLMSSTLDTLRDFAEMTGGRAFYNSNDITGGFRRAVDDSSSYYLLSYYLDTKNTKAGWRRLKVKVNRDGAEARARGGFFVTRSTVNPEAARETAMEMAIASPFDSTGIGVTVNWRAISSDGDKKKVGFALHVLPASITLEHTSDTHYDLDFFFMAIKNGTAADSYGQTVHGTPSADTLAKLKADGLAYNNSLELPPGNYTVRFVVRDNLSGKVGSVSAPLTVN